MTAEDQKAAMANVILAFVEQKERYSLLKNEIDSIANALERGAKLLKEHPESWSFDGDDLPLKDYRGLGKLVEDVKTTQNEIIRLRDVAAQGGFESRLR